MSAVRVRPSPLLHTASLLMATLVVHELRYRLAYGEQAHEVLSHEGHGYLGAVAPLVGLLAAFALARLLLHTAASVPARTRHPRLRVMWPACSAALFGLYSSQELVEGLLFEGHPSGWTGVMGGGGWIALPLALAIGALLAAGLRVARAVEGRVVVAVVLRWRPVPSAGWAPRAQASSPLIGRLLAAALAGRGPPSVSV